MTDWLLDTNVLSELRRVAPDAKVVRFVAVQPLERLFVSSVTFAEIWFGIERAPDPARRAESNNSLAGQTKPLKFPAQAILP